MHTAGVRWHAIAVGLCHSFTWGGERLYDALRCEKNMVNKKKVFSKNLPNLFSIALHLATTKSHITTILIAGANRFYRLFWIPSNEWAFFHVNRSMKNALEWMAMPVVVLVVWLENASPVNEFQFVMQICCSQRRRWYCLFPQNWLLLLCRSMNCTKVHRTLLLFFFFKIISSFGSPSLSLFLFLSMCVFCIHSGEHSI